MMKKVGAMLLMWLVLCGVTVGGQKLSPYQDYIIILVHGINDYKNSFDGTNSEWDAAKRERTNVVKMLRDRVGIPLGHIQNYSYTQCRGTNLQNAMELGYRGFRAPLRKGNVVLESGTDSIKGAVQDVPWLRQLDGNPLPYVAYNNKTQRNEYFSYNPALDQYFPTGVEPGNCFLEQAVKDWKQWYLTSDLNKDPSQPRGLKYQTIELIPASIVPKKYIIISHSMGNFSTRLYIYSNELAERKWLFTKGFYRNDVVKAVMVAAPTEGSELAVLSPLSPIVQIYAQGGGIVKEMQQGFNAGMNLNNVVPGVANGLNSPAGLEPAKTYTKAGEDVGDQMGLWLNRLKNPLLTVKNPWWPFTESNWFIQKVDLVGQLIASKAPIETMLGIRGEPRGWNQAALELVPDELDLGFSTVNLNTIGDAKEGWGRVVHALKQVQKADKREEPSYSLVYGRGLPTLSFADSYRSLLKKAGLSTVLSSEVPTEVLSNGYTGLGSATSQFESSMWTRKFAGYLTFTQDSDLAVPVWSGRGEKTAHLKDALRIEKRFDVPEWDEVMGKTVPMMVGAVEGAGVLALIYGGPSTQELVLMGGRLGIISYITGKYIELQGKFQYYHLAHQEMYGAHDEIIKGLLDTPLITFKDSQYLASQNILWGGVFEVTKNAQASASAGELYQPITVTSGGETFQILRIATLNQETTSLDDPERILFNADPRGQGPDGTVGDQKLSVIATDKERLYLRGLIQDLVPKKVVAQYSMNFGGWTDLQSRIQEDGRFELGPIPLSEGQNIVAFKLRNQAGYSSNQYLKILKTGITLQPVLDELSPQPDSITNNKTIQVKLVYQNMKYSDTAANKIAIDELYVQVDPIQNPGVPTPSIPFSPTTNIITAFPDQVRKSQPNVNNLNRLELVYTLPSLPDGRYTIIAKAHDAYNTESYLRYGFSVDRTPPRIKILKMGVYNPHKGQK
ncbi:MAG: hypothetical protein AB7F28_03205 [Candidatus Margulisiibacteriota bacterium]